MNYAGKVILFTSFYKQQTIAPYCKSLVLTTLLLKELGIKFDYWPIQGDFHIERAINYAITKFGMDKTATDFINIDSDESWNPADIIKLLNYEEEIVAASYRITNSWDKFTGAIKRADNGMPIGRLITGDSAILEAERVPAGFIRIKKNVVQRFIEEYPDAFFYGEDNVKVYQFFWNEIKDHQFTGMDYVFSDKLKTLGFKLWIDPNIDIGHWGITEYKGSLDKHLRAVKAMNDLKVGMP
jgi:hypothetical protein